MTHPTDDELDALVQELMNRPYRRGSESNDEAAMRRQGEREQAAAAITALRAQLADVQAERDYDRRQSDHKSVIIDKLNSMLTREKEANAAANARADRAEAALAAQPHDPAKVQALVGAAEAMLNFIQNTESEMGVILGCGDKARAALAAMKEG